jgi:glycosyltransferase involved in cell wall biosynthesis
MKVLSILVPAYQYPEGVRNILQTLLSDYRDQLEIIVGDDSINDDVFSVIQEFIQDNKGVVKYIKNSPSLGAVKNWNSLLGKATGKYILLMHHDEFPMSQDWIYHLLEKLDSPNPPYVILMPCVIYAGLKAKVRVHLPRIIQLVTLKYFPSYLFRRNVIGPTSCLVIRRELYPRFDENLRWLVDVDMYWRLLKSTKNFSIDRDLKIASFSNRKNSITKSIASEVIEIRESELNYLREKFSNASVWLNPGAHCLLFICETFLWGIFKGIYLIYSCILSAFKL